MPHGPKLTAVTPCRRSRENWHADTALPQPQMPGGRKLSGGGESKETGKAVKCPQEGSLRQWQSLGESGQRKGGSEHSMEKKNQRAVPRQRPHSPLGGQAQQGGCVLLTWLEQDDSVSRRRGMRQRGWLWPLRRLFPRPGGRCGQTLQPNECGVWSLQCPQGVTALRGTAPNSQSKPSTRATRRARSGGRCRKKPPQNLVKANCHEKSEKGPEF